MVVDFLAGLLAYGYVGIFLVSLLGSATIILPIPYFGLIFAVAPLFNPILLTIASALGSALGEFIGYMAGKLGRHFVIKKDHKWLKLAKKWFTNNGFLTLFFFAAAPIPTDIGGIVAGALNYDKRKFFIAMFAGKMVKFAMVVYAGYYSLGAILGYFGFA